MCLSNTISLVRLQMTGTTQSKTVCKETDQSVNVLEENFRYNIGLGPQTLKARHILRENVVCSMQ